MSDEMLHEDRRRAQSFGAAAERYDRTRPGYPPELVAALLEGQARAVVDVGCGTGIVARLFIAQGCHVLGVEADPRMAEVARRHGVTVEEAHFETWDRMGRTFDVLSSGQAWHWVDPVAGAARAAEALRPGGRIGVFWNYGRRDHALGSRFSEIYGRLAPDVDRHSVLLGNNDQRRWELAARTLEDAGFLDVEVRTYPWEATYSRDEWLDLLPTHSDHHIMEPARLELLLGEIGGAIDAAGGSFSMTYETWLVTGRR
jgi:SAM-dependent methyltransferase